MLWFLFCSCFLLTVGYHNASLYILFTSKNNYMAGIIRKWERERERGEAGGVGGKGRVLRDRMSRKICQIQCFSTEALTPRIITPGKPRNSPLNQVISLFFSYYKSLWNSFRCVSLHRKEALVKDFLAHTHKKIFFLCFLTCFPVKCLNSLETSNLSIFY